MLAQRLFSTMDPVTEDDVLTRIVLRDAFLALNPRQQAILGLRLMGYTQQGTATILHISRTSVWTIEQAALACISAAVLTAGRPE